VEDKREADSKIGIYVHISSTRVAAGFLKRKCLGSDSEKWSRERSLYRAGLRFKDMQGKERPNASRTRLRFPCREARSTVSREKITKRRTKIGDRGSVRVITARCRERDRRKKRGSIQNPCRKDTFSFSWPSRHTPSLYPPPPQSHTLLHTHASGSSTPAGRSA